MRYFITVFIMLLMAFPCYGYGTIPTIESKQNIIWWDAYQLNIIIDEYLFLNDKDMWEFYVNDCGPPDHVHFYQPIVWNGMDYNFKKKP